MKRTWIVAGLAGLAVVGGMALAGAQSRQTGVAEAQQTTARFSVENMTCATCPISVKKAMMRVDGVKSVKIDFRTKTAEVVYDPAATSPEMIAAASTNVGYPAVRTS
ncbi:MAG: heavy-metal-associated domain-containing protein [Hyphomonas sp.]|jgi:mercuric ion binding protein|uniref:heavy-metal-associated domain-containing protein n=1 Tax=Hyphomonas sp. TaxID=87 RepID=UPI001828820E|nr:heavy metal-associated domain-containing protein [Hyphomonas sp.]MBA3069849.1 heavy-metal-associated domain-containing protein [Hyphomonas sp.]MBU3919942.1 heavy-metal-associated domain-containing protein [Alphaproteobacteria bacterium]MBU4063549.1 heavy-metal-associated domain-containing protein [Alphaproteobacteria bacterium]MBU4162776.1 heavy-metal-associated domain-containing protein [Alphaproteobacteria bacterium]